MPSQKSNYFQNHPPNQQNQNKETENNSSSQDASQDFKKRLRLANAYCDTERTSNSSDDDENEYTESVLTTEGELLQQRTKKILRAKQLLMALVAINLILDIIIFWLSLEGIQKCNWYSKDITRSTSCYK